MKLNVLIAKSGHCSRRAATELIKSGKVTVGGEIVLEPWHEARPDDEISIAGKPLARQERLVYVVLNKPKGVTSTLEDRFAKEKVTDLIPKKYGRLYPVGRLDKESRGLIILTNDGELCHKLTHPRFEVVKEYILTVKGVPDAKTLSQAERGIFDGQERLKVLSARLVSTTKIKSILNVALHEGKKRHLRRLFLYLGNPVTDVRRVRIGNLQLGDLKEGAHRILPKKIIYELTLGKGVV